MSKEEFYSLKNILKTNAHYYIIISGRSDGKTFSVQEYGIDRYVKYNEQMAIIRRYSEDYKGKRGHETFSGILGVEGKISKMTKGKWDTIKYYSSAWYLAKKDEKLDKLITDEKPFCYGFALTQMEHDKSTSYPKVTTILFDEFMTRDAYLPNEWVLFQNTLSTIIRLRNDVKIFMCGNTVNKYSPYFAEMGINNIDKIEQGTISIYKYGNTDLTVALEYPKSVSKKLKKSNVYFAFDNPKLEMIQNGAWEISIYPHLPYKYYQNDIKFTYFIEFDNHILQCEIIKLNKNEEHEKCEFTYIHKKTTILKNKKNDIIFTKQDSPYKRIRKYITRPYDEIGSIIYSYYKDNKVFYQDNNIGEIVRNYLMWSKTDKGVL